jgi:hypothetical protein
MEYFRSENFFCDGLKLDHFVHHVMDVFCRNFKIRFVPEACIGAFKEMKSHSFLVSCSDKDLIDIMQVETEERQAFIKIVTVHPETGDGLILTSPLKLCLCLGTFK